MGVNCEIDTKWPLNGKDVKMQILVPGGILVPQRVVATEIGT